MDTDMLLNTVLDTFLLECVGDRVEEPSEVPRMLKDIAYLDNKDELISKITECEILDVDDYEIKNYSVVTDNIKIEYEMSFILQVYADADAFWRIQGTAQCVFSIPGPEAYDWSIFQNDNMNKQQLLAHKDLLNFESFTYDFIECDTI